jgi:hypothetical protein
MTEPHLRGERPEQAWGHHDGRRAVDRAPSRVPSRVPPRMPAIVATGEREVS